MMQWKTLLAVQRVLCIAMVFIRMSYCDQGLNGNSTTSEGRLIQALVDDGYDRRVRPARLPQDIVEVDMLFILYSLFELDVRQEVVSGAAWIKVSWEDHRLSWNELDYDDIRYVVIDADSIWTLDLVLQNSALDSADNPFQSSGTKVIVLSNGTVVQNVPLRFVTSCLTNVENFPFDNQTCTVTITSPSFPEELFKPRNLTSTIGNLGNNQWRIGLGRAYHDHIFDSDLGKMYRVHFEITLKRLANYYIINVVLPSSLINVMSLIAYWVPPDSGEKLSTAVSLLLGVVVFEIVVTDFLPISNHQMPLLARLIFVNFLVSCGCVVSAVISLRIYKSARKIRSPFWRAFWFRFMANVVRVKHNFVPSAAAADSGSMKSSPSKGRVGSANQHEQGYLEGSRRCNSCRGVHQTQDEGDNVGGQPVSDQERTHDGTVQQNEQKEKKREMEVVAEIVNRSLFVWFLCIYLAFLVYWSIVQTNVTPSV